MKQPTLLILAFLATGCLFEGENSGAPRPRTTYDFTRLDSLPNPLARWYPLAGNRSMVGVKFAFRSMEYEKEVDSNLVAFALEAGSRPAIAGAYFDLSSQPKNMKRFLDAVGAQDFSITGLGERLKALYASARFQFSFAPILAGSVSAP